MDEFQLPSDQDAGGRTLSAEEIAAVTDALRSGVLTSTKGTWVRRLESRFAKKLGSRHAFACTSGTSAVHLAVAALDPEPGDEIVTTSVTDMGALAPILYQGAIPVFADVDPRTLNVTADTLAARITERTKALVVTHLFGSAVEMEPVVELAKERGIAVIEDCAQAFLAQSGGRMVGTLGDLGCFSLQQGKHITTGEGGLVVTDDDTLARRVFLHVNKAWGYGDENPDHYFLALNHRMSELQGAVGAAQLEKLDRIVASRQRAAAVLSERLRGLYGVGLPDPSPTSTHVYWRYALQIDEEKIDGGAVGVGMDLREQGIACAPRYIQKPAFECAVFRDQKTFGSSRYPFSLASEAALDHRRERFPGTYNGLARVLVLPWNERYEDGHVEFLAERIIDSVTQRAGKVAI